MSEVVVSGLGIQNFRLMIRAKQFDCEFACSLVQLCSGTPKNSCNIYIYIDMFICVYIYIYTYIYKLRALNLHNLKDLRQV